ncbi:MAG: hypothetical protein KDK25_03165 [Leptospiraceae bacterium]|nr:hypothetical protein [Leptospiraceae bacterium]
MCIAKFWKFTALALLGFASGACSSPSMSYAEYQSSELSHRSLVYVSIRCQVDSEMGFYARVKGEGSVDEDCHPGEIKRYSFPLGEGIYSFRAVLPGRKFMQWRANLFVVPPREEHRITYWGRVTLAMFTEQTAVLAIEEDPADLKRIELETGIEAADLHRGWTVEDPDRSLIFDRK